MDSLLLIPAAVAGYLVGSIPMGVLLARLFGWPDPRTHGSHHTGGLNISRGAGVAAGALVLLLDAAKGAFAVWLATRIAPSPWAIVAGGVGAVVGHCWPVWLRFDGGMGLATGMGAVVVYAPLAVLIAAALLGALRFTLIRHTPRATIVAALLVPVALLLLRVTPPVFGLGTAVSLIIALRHTADWNRQYA